MNRKFGNIVGPIALDYAPDCLINSDGTTTFAPTEKQYNAAGWWRIDDTPPTPREGFTPVRTAYELDGTVIVSRWDYEPIPEAPHVYLVEEIIYQLVVRGKLDAVKEVLGGYYDLVTMRETVSSDNEILREVFPTVREKLVEEGILTGEEIEEILAEAEV